jgi:hypothetical protein
VLVRPPRLPPDGAVRTGAPARRRCSSCSPEPPTLAGLDALADRPLRYTKASKTWTLYWRDRNSRFHRYDRIEPSANVGALIDEIDYDPTGIFCG